MFRRLYGLRVYCLSIFPEALLFAGYIPSGAHPCGYRRLWSAFSNACAHGEACVLLERTQSLKVMRLNLPLRP